MPSMIDCFEPAEVWGTVASQPDTSSFYYDYYMMEASHWQKICPVLPKPEPALIYQPGRPQQSSVLLINSYLDPYFSPESMDLALKEFTKSRLVAEPTDGYILKRDSPETLIRAVRTVAHGGSSFSPHIVDILKQNGLDS